MKFIRGLMVAAGLTLMTSNLEVYQNFYPTVEVATYYDAEENKYSCYDKETTQYLFSITQTIHNKKATTNVNIRVAPNTNSKSIGLLYKGKTIQVMGVGDTGWALAKLDDSFYYIWDAFLEESNDEPITLASELTNLTYWGNCRISSYCYNCNTPRYSYKSGVSGWPCSAWETCAANGIPKGTHLYIEGFGEFVVNDSGPSAMNGGHWIDIFVDNNSCNIWCKRDVYIIN